MWVRHRLFHLDWVSLLHRYIVILHGSCPISCRRRLPFQHRGWGSVDTRPGGGGAEVIRVSLMTWPSESGGQGCALDIWSSVYSRILGVKSLFSYHLGPIHGWEELFPFLSEFSCLRPCLSMRFLGPPRTVRSCPYDGQRDPLWQLEWIKELKVERCRERAKIKSGERRSIPKFIGGCLLESWAS